MLKKNQTSISQDIEEKILSMYAKGMTTGDIEAHIQDIYGVEVLLSIYRVLSDLKSYLFLAKDPLFSDNFYRKSRHYDKADKRNKEAYRHIFLSCAHLTRSSTFFVLARERAAYSCASF